MCGWRMKEGKNIKNPFDPTYKNRRKLRLNNPPPSITRLYTHLHRHFLINPTRPQCSARMTAKTKTGAKHVIGLFRPTMDSGCVYIQPTTAHLHLYVGQGILLPPTVSIDCVRT